MPTLTAADGKTRNDQTTKNQESLSKELFSKLKKTVSKMVSSEHKGKKKDF